MGFEMATKAGISIGIFDMIIPDEKKDRYCQHVKKSIKLKINFAKVLLLVENDIIKLLMFGQLRRMTLQRMYLLLLEENLGKDTINPVYLNDGFGCTG